MTITNRETKAMQRLMGTKYLKQPQEEIDSLQKAQSAEHLTRREVKVQHPPQIPKTQNIDWIKLAAIGGGIYGSVKAIQELRLAREDFLTLGILFLSPPLSAGDSQIPVAPTMLEDQGQKVHKTLTAQSVNLTDLTNPLLEVSKYILSTVQGPSVKKPVKKAWWEQEDEKLRQDPRAQEWYRHIRPGGIIFETGHPRTGKTTTAYDIVSIIHAFEPFRRCFVVKLPPSLHKLLPPWFGVIDKPEDAPDGSVIMYDEAQIRYHSRQSLSATSRDLFNHLASVGQRNLTEIYICHRTRVIDIDILDMCSVFISKEPGPFQKDLERPGVKKIFGPITEAYGKVKGDKRRYTYIKCKDFEGMLQSKLPYFWNDKLSRPLAAGQPSQVGKPSIPQNFEDKIKDVKARKDAVGVTALARQYGVSRQTIYNWLNCQT